MLRSRSRDRRLLDCARAVKPDAAHALMLQIWRRSTHVAQEVANVMWAAATLRQQTGGECATPAPVQALSHNARRALCRAAKRLAMQMNSQDVANTLWALAVMGNATPAGLARALLAAVMRVALIMNAQDVANLLWTFAELGKAPTPGSWAALLKAAVRTAPDMAALELSSTLLSLAMLQVRVHGKLQTALLGAAHARLPEMDAQGLANLLFAAAWFHIDQGAARLPIEVASNALAGMRNDLKLEHFAQVHSKCKKLHGTFASMCITISRILVSSILTSACMTLTGEVVQVHVAAAILQPQRSSAELEQLLAAARAASVQNALAEQRTSDAEGAICRSINQMCATCVTPVDVMVRPVLTAGLRPAAMFVVLHLTRLALQV
jgi:hypothetical protein